MHTTMVYLMKVRVMKETIITYTMVAMIVHKPAYRPVDHFSMGLFDRPTAAPVQQKFCVEVRSDQLNQPEFTSSPNKFAISRGRSDEEWRTPAK